MKRVSAMKKLTFVLSMLVVLFLITSCVISDNPDTSGTSTDSVSESSSSNSESNTSNTGTSDANSDKSDQETSVVVLIPADPDEIKLSFSYCNEETLKQYDSTFNYTDNIGTEQIIFIAIEAKSDVSYVSIKWDIDDGFTKSGPSVDQTLFTVDTLTPEKPLVIKNTFIPEIPPSDRGITFKDKDGNERFFIIDYNGKDEMVLYEFENK